MIIVRLTSGLGNQMYQYSFYELMKERYGEDLVRADVTWFNANNDHHGYELERIFSNVKDSEFSITYSNFFQMFNATGIIPNYHGKLFEKFRRYPNRIIREFTQGKRKPYILDQLSGDICNLDKVDDKGNIYNEFYEKVMNLDTSKEWYIQGFFIEQNYYLNRLDKVKKCLVFPEINKASAKEFEKQILECNSVSLHVRRGDYLSDLYKDMFISLGRDYYEKAVNFIREKVDNPMFFIFSDDKDFVEKEFNWLPEKVIVTGNDGNDSYIDMQLMSLCKHNIIANSTFSQWGSLLNKNEEHYTIYPKAYLKDQDNELKKIPGWIMI